MINKIKVLFVSLRSNRISLSSFTRRDLEFLEKHFIVKPLFVNTFLIPRRGRDPLVFWKLFKEMLSSDLIYSWWGDLNSLFIVLFGMFMMKKNIVVIGGGEVAHEPEINYGALIRVSSRIRLKFILKHSSMILAVSKSSANEIKRFVKPNNIKMIYNGVDTEKFKPGGKKRDLVITVGFISRDTMMKKRFDIFVEAAKYLPETEFVLIGKHIDDSVNDLKKNSGPNVSFPGYVSNEDLLRYYQQAKVYCQLSNQESFGVALAEAMSCCCVPVVTNRYSLPEVVGDGGFYASYGDPNSTSKAIIKALNSTKGSKARIRIQKYFNLKIRERKIFAEILKLARARA